LTKASIEEIDTVADHLGHRLQTLRGSIHLMGIRGRERGGGP
jgi:hypothetical protein